MSVVPGLQATTLVGHNLKALKLKGKAIQPKKIIKLGITNIIGASLIRPTAKLVNKL